MSLTSNWFIVFFKFFIFLLTYYPDVLIHYWKYDINVSNSDCWFYLSLIINLGFLYFWVLFGVYIFIIVTSSRIDSSYERKVLIFISRKFFDVTSILLDVSIATPVLLVTVINVECILYVFTFNPFVSLDVKCVFCRH